MPCVEHIYIVLLFFRAILVMVDYGIGDIKYVQVIKCLLLTDPSLMDWFLFNITECRVIFVRGYFCPSSLANGFAPS